MNLATSLREMIRVKQIRNYEMSILELTGPEMDLELRLLSRMSKAERRQVARSLLTQLKPWLRHFTRQSFSHTQRWVGPQSRKEIRLFEAQNLGTDSGTFGLEIRRKRLEVGLSQAELAKRAGLTRTHLSEIERGNSLPHKSTRARLIRELPDVGFQ